MAQLSLFDLEASRAARDEALDRVIRHAGAAWEARALAVIRRLPVGWTGIGEEVNRKIVQEVGPPHDQHAFGSLWRIAAKRGYLWHVGATLPMRVVSSHARASLVWRRVDEFSG